MRIRTLRKRAGMTQAQLAGEMGVTPSTIMSWEQEVYLPRVRQLPLLARVLNCTIGELFAPNAEWAL